MTPYDNLPNAVGLNTVNDSVFMKLVLNVFRRDHFDFYDFKFSKQKCKIQISRTCMINIQQNKNLTDMIYKQAITFHKALVLISNGIT